MQGAVDSSSIGELWCSYEIEFFKPQFIEDVSTQTAYFNGNMLHSLPNPTNPFGGSGPLIHIDPKTSNWNCWIDPSDVANSDRIYIPDSIGKRVLINLVYSWSGTITMSSTPTLTPTGARYVRYLQDSTLPVGGGAMTTIKTGAVVANSWGIIQGMIEITSDVCYVQIGSFNYTPNISCTGWSCTISEIGPDTCEEFPPA